MSLYFATKSLPALAEPVACTISPAPTARRVPTILRYNVAASRLLRENRLRENRLNSAQSTQGLYSRAYSVVY